MSFKVFVSQFLSRIKLSFSLSGRLTEGKVSDVHSGGHIDGDGGVVDCRVEGDLTTWQDICCW